MESKHLTTDIIIIIVFIVSGYLSGIAAGLFGIGGGTVLVPLFLTVFHILGISPTLDIHIAIATSLALIIPTACSASYAQYTNNNLDLHISKRWIPGISVGVIFGVLLLHVVPGLWLKVFFSFYLLFCIVFNLLTKEDESGVSHTPPFLALITLSPFVGCFSTLIGIGGGTFTTPILTFFKYPLRKALGISSFTGLFIGTIGAFLIMMTTLSAPNLPSFSFGYVNWMAFILVAPTSIFGSRMGVLIANKLTQIQLKNIYTGFLCFVLCVMLYHLLL